MNLKKGFYLVSGKTKLTLLAESEVYCIGKRLVKDESVDVPEGKRIPIELETDAEFEFEFSKSYSEQVTTLQERSIPAYWDALVDRVIQEKLKTILVLGEVDTGKTFFSTYLANRLIEIAKNKVSIIDLDAGQSDIGPPGTLGLAVLTKPEVFLTELKPTALYYLGSHSPALHFIPYITGFCILTKNALSISDVLIVDTPGWVQGDGGRALHRAEIELLEPDLIVLLERSDELEHLIRNYDQQKVERVTVSKKVSYTSPDERKKLRELVSEKYFSSSVEFELPFKQISTDRVYLLTGQEMDLSELAPITSQLSTEIIYCEKLSGYEGVLCVSQQELNERDLYILRTHLQINKIKNIVTGTEVGVEVALCNKNSEVISLAIIKKIDYRQKKFVLFAPIEKEEITKIKIIQFGSLRLTFDGKENGFVEPGYF